MASTGGGARGGGPRGAMPGPVGREGGATGVFATNRLGSIVLTSSMSGRFIVCVRFLGGGAIGGGFTFVKSSLGGSTGGGPGGGPAGLETPLRVPSVLIAAYKEIAFRDAHSFR